MNGKTQFDIWNAQSSQYRFSHWGFVSIYYYTIFIFSFKTGYQEKEIGEETVYFHKEDEKLLKNLLKKVRAQATQNDAQGSAAATAQEIQELQKIVGSKLTEDEMRGMLKWVCVGESFDCLF